MTTPNEEPEFIPVKCSKPECGYEWVSRTAMKYVVCPKCMNKTATGL